MTNATADECALVHILAFHDDTCGPFSAALGAKDGDCFPSALTVNATTDLDNTFVQCFGPTPDTQVGNGTLKIVGEWQCCVCVCMCVCVCVCVCVCMCMCV